MKAKIICALLLLAVVMATAGCNVKIKDDARELFTTASQSSTEPEQTTAEATTQEATTEVTTEATTAKPTQAATKKKTEKTTAEKTTAAEAKTSKVDLSEYGDSVKYKEKNETEKKYGVIVSKTVKIAYRTLRNGKTEELERTVISAECVRIGYSASYNDLLPAAKKHASEYSDFIERVVEIVNGWRRDAGLRPLKLSSKLTEIANVRAEEVAWSGKHGHYRPNGKFFSSIFKEKGYETGVVGENLGWGYGTPEAVCNAWKNSKTHYENIMKPEFTRIGVGVAPDADPTHKYVWVQHFSGNDLG